MANYNLTQTGAEVQELLNKVSLFGKFTCRDAADSQEKNIHIDDFTLIDSVAIAVTFVNGNSAASIRLNVNYTGNVPVYYRDSPLGAGLFTSNATVILMYNATGNRWDVLSELCGTIGEAASRDVATEITDESSDEDIPTVGALKGIMKGLPEQDCSFVFRKTAGGELTVPSGLAQLTAMRGKSLVWNQLMPLASYSGKAAGLTVICTQGKYTISGTATSGGGTTLSPRITTITGHKYFLHLNGTQNFNSFSWRGVPLESMRSRIFTESVGTSNTSIVINTTAGNEYNASFEFFVIDLTLMFGAGNEPATVEEFEAMFPNDYYPYNEGSLLNFNAASLKTIGFNQWDEEWEVGDIDNTTGQNIDMSTAWRNKKYIDVIPNTTYYFYKNAINYSLRYYWYDANKQFISAFVLSIRENAITSPSNARYLRIRSTGGVISYTKGSICINIPDPSKNGTYEPYWESNLPLNINTLTGKLDGSGNSVVVFPNGMAGMNGVQDTIIGNTAVKKFYQVNDLTTLPITLNYEGYAPDEEGGDTMYSFILELPKNAKAFTASVMNGLFNKKYSAAYGISAASYNNFYIYTLQGKSYVEIMDDDFSEDARFDDEEQWDALIADIRTSLADKVLMYELLSYESYTLDDMTMPLSYKIDKDGTEQIIPNSTDPDNTVPSTVPCDMTAKYKLSHVEEIWSLFDMCHNG